MDPVVPAEDKKMGKENEGRPHFYLSLNLD